MMTTTVREAKEAVAERLNPALESLEEKMRGARRAMTHGRHATEDLAADAALHVRRHPLASLAMAGAAGAVAGLLFGLAIGWQVRRTRP
jgi:ElaB/YqjD/DUF883 family membrane-anchored ribosome-binding protein